MMTVRIMQGKGLVEEDMWVFLLTGGVALDNPYDNPCKDWLQDKNWGEICRCSDNVDGFKGLRESFGKLGEEWRAMYNSTNPETHVLAGEWEKKLTGMQRLLVLRCIRSDKLINGVQNFIIDNAGEKYMKPPQFDLEVSSEPHMATSITELTFSHSIRLAPSSLGAAEL